MDPGTSGEKHSNIKPNSSGISRLREEQEKNLKACLNNIDQWKKFHKDYENLHSFLGTVPDKLTYDVMVPFGKLAFMPGKLVDTNNVLVLLGDNWFVERSAKEAQAIAHRRLKSCQDTLENLEKEKRRAQDWIEHTGLALGEDGIQEIIEDYNPVKDTSWKEKRKQRGSTTNSNQNQSPRGVKWKDQEVPNPAKISFKHSDQPPPETLQFQEAVKGQTVLSPGDILPVFGTPTTEHKSILKPSRSQEISLPKSPVQEKRTPEDRDESLNQAFTGNIVEKVSGENPVIEKDTCSRPTSRFKAERKKK